MKHKSDYLIGRRCYDFLIKKYGTVGNVLKSTPVKKIHFMDGRTAIQLHRHIGYSI